MTELPDWTIQLSLKAGDNMLNVRGVTTGHVFSLLEGLGIDGHAVMKRFNPAIQPTDRRVLDHNKDGTPRTIEAVKHVSNRGYQDVVATEDPTIEKKCPACGSNVHDNRNDPNRGKRPVFKCKNYKECKGYTDPKTGDKGPWVTWDEDFFTPKLPAPPAEDPSQYDWSAPR